MSILIVMGEGGEEVELDIEGGEGALQAVLALLFGAAGQDVLMLDEEPCVPLRVDESRVQFWEN